MNTDFNEKHISSFSFLEFGSIDPSTSEKQVYDFRTQSQAYDWLMHARYSNDIFAYLKMSEALKQNDFGKITDCYLKNMHHPNDFSFNLNKYIALSITGKHFFELGQTLYGCIEGLEFIDQLLTKFDISLSQDFQSYKWSGFDISDFFNTLAPQMHARYQLETTDNVNDLANEFDVFFAKGVTLLYSLRKTQDFFSWVSKSKMGVFDLSLSTGEGEDSVIGTGKGIHFLSQDDFLKTYKQQCKSKQIIVRAVSGSSEKGKIYLEGIWGSPEQIVLFQTLDFKIRNALQKEHPWSQGLFHQSSPEYMEWITLEEALEQK